VGNLAQAILRLPGIGAGGGGGGGGGGGARGLGFFSGQGAEANPTVFSDPVTGMQFPSGYGQGSAYSLDPADMGPGNRAADNQSFGDQSAETIGAFVATYGPEAAEAAWIAEHNQATGNAFAGGGTVPGAYGSPRNITAHGGEFVLTREQFDGLLGSPGGGGGGGDWSHGHDIVLDGRVVGRAMEPYVTGAQAHTARIEYG
jgi:hypothetical protein